MSQPLSPQISSSLRAARKQAGLTMSQLAQRAGLDRTTVHNVETGRHMPSPETLRRLNEVLRPDDLGAGDEPAFAGMFSPRYEPLKLHREMLALLNGPGGTLEQTFSYLDLASANAWYVVSNNPVYVEKFKLKIPVAPFAEEIAKQVDDNGLDLIALGVGDGKSEVRLAQPLLQQLGARSLQIYLLDISHPLLVSAYNHAGETLPSTVPIFPVHANFLDLGRVLPLQQPGRKRRRLWTMFGGTIGNLTDEPRFLRDFGAFAREGDLLLVDLQLVWAPARNLAAVRRADPVLSHPLPEENVRWLTETVRSHCPGFRKVRLTVSVSNLVPLPGSYELIFTAHVETTHGPRKFDVFRARRYDLDRLRRDLSELGWQQLRAEKYGPAPEHTALLLLQRC